ncbi:MAG: signal peptidase II [Candidatus Omnitrophica bacterium]|nr:signal peptidase II [Candidatus Omnitrophota bacterium]
MIILYSIAGIVLLLDQLTKFFALAYLSSGHIPIVPHVFHLSLVENTGVAFGFFRGHPELLTGIITVSVLCLFAFSKFFWRETLYRRVAYGLILGGAIGNWIDRLRFEHVIDFLDFRVWPVFNIADACITIGVSLFVLAAFRGR